MPEMQELSAGLYGLTLWVMDAVGDDEGIAGVLVEQLVGLDVQRGRERVPDHLVDANDLPAVVVAIECIAQTDQEHALTIHRVHINRAVEGHRQPGLKVEPVQFVENGNVLAVRNIHRTVGVGQVDPPIGVLGSVGDGEAVRGEGTGRGGVQLEQGVDAAVRRGTVGPVVALPVQAISQRHNRRAGNDEIQIIRRVTNIGLCYGRWVRPQERARSGGRRYRGGRCAVLDSMSHRDLWADEMPGRR